MKHKTFTRLLSVLAFGAAGTGLSAQWTLKHASSVIISDYLPCHSVISSKVYMVGSPDNTNYYVYEYDPVANTYTQKVQTTILGFNDQVSFTLNSQMYLVGFSNQASYAYDPTTDNWITKDNTNSLGSILAGLYPPSSYGLVFNNSLFAFVLNNKAYIGGLTVMDLTTSMQSMSPYVFVYDPVADSYSVLTVSAIAVDYNVLDPTTFELNGKGYVAGTENDPQTFSGSPGVFEFDPSGNTFTPKNSCSCGNMAHSSFVLNNLAYVNVVQNCSDKSPVFAFDPVANTWTPSDTILLPDTADLRLGYAVNGKGYLGYGLVYTSACGINGNNSQLYEYSPTVTAVAGSSSSPGNVPVFPNPASTVVTFMTDGAFGTLTLFDQLGREVKRQQLNGEKRLELSVAGLGDGMYFYHIVKNNRSVADGKIMVWH